MRPGHTEELVSHSKWKELVHTEWCYQPLTIHAFEPSVDASAGAIKRTVAPTLMLKQIATDLFQKFDRRVLVVSQRCPRGIPEMFQRCFSSVSKVFEMCSRVVPEVSQRCLRGVPEVFPEVFQRCFRCVSKVFQKCPRSALEVF